jgi:AcrR family transcriptional regulator
VSTDEPLTSERILDAAEEVLRRYGPAKTTVVDVARALGVSHGSVYRHFATKAALRDAVVERWLHRLAAPLDAIVTADATAVVRLRRWLDRLIAAKRERALEDPELFATYVALAADAREVVRAHVEALVAQLARIIAEGVADGELTTADPTAAAHAVFDATTRFHNPAHAASWSEPGIDADYEAVWTLVAAGLGARDTASPAARRRRRH